MNRTDTTRLGCVAALAGIAAVLLVAGHAQATIIEHGVDTAGTSGTVPLTYGDHTLNAALKATETDSYTFNGKAGETVRIQVHGFTNDLDMSIVLRSPTGTVIGSSFCSTNQFFTCSTELTRLLPANGIYTMNLSDAGVDNGGQYQLHFDEHPPTTRLTALAFGSQGTIQTALQHTTDVDSFSFMAGAGSGFRIAAAGGSNDLDLRLQMWAPDGSLVKESGCVTNQFFTCSTFIEYDVTSAGLYRVSVADTGWDNGGNYAISLSCTYGVCPPLPEPQTYALLAGGLGMLGMALRRRRSPDR